MRILALGLMLGALCACSDEATDQTPEGAAQLFVDALDRARLDSDARQDVEGLLATETRRELVDRARSTTALGAREIHAWEIIVENRTLLRFRPAHAAAYRARDGEEPGTAIVTVSGERDSDRAELLMRHEDDGWRVVIAIPPRVAAD